MNSNSSPPLGAIAYGTSGLPCVVIACHPTWITLKRPDQSLINVCPSAIVHWELISAANTRCQLEISSESSAESPEALKQLMDLTFTADNRRQNYRQPAVSTTTTLSVATNIVSGTTEPSAVKSIVSGTRQIEQGSSDIADDSDDIISPLSGCEKSKYLSLVQSVDVYQSHPGSIATPVTERVLDVLKYTSPKYWKVGMIAQLPYLGGASIEQVKGACHRLAAKGLAKAEGEGKEMRYCWKALI